MPWGLEQSATQGQGTQRLEIQRAELRATLLWIRDSSGARTRCKAGLKNLETGGIKRAEAERAGSKSLSLDWKPASKGKGR